MQQKGLLFVGGIMVLAVMGTAVYFLMRPSGNEPQVSSPTVTDTPPPLGPGSPTLPGTQIGPDATQQAFIVKYQDGRFQPNLHSVRLGTTITFLNDDTAPLWVASDPHPTHTGLPGFDSGQGMDKGETYEYTFTKAGTFGYHNHLAPSAQGTVEVFSSGFAP